MNASYGETSGFAPVTSDELTTVNGGLILVTITLVSTAAQIAGAILMGLGIAGTAALAVASSPSHK